MHKQDQESNMRDSPRISRRFTARVKPKDSSDAKWQVPILKNISESGCFFIGGVVHEIGEILEIEIQFPTLSEPMRFLGEVVRSETDDKLQPPVHRIGVHFKEMDESKRHKFAETIDFFLKKLKKE
jgi:hypothetical protein